MEARASELSRRDRNKQKNRQEIVRAALEVFAEKGYDQASIQEIADRADFAVSTLYGLFESKEDIYHKVSAYVGRTTGELFDEAMGRGADEYEKLVNFARAKGAVYRESPEGVRMLEHEQHHARLTGQPLPKNGIGEIYERFMTRIRDLFASGVKRGLFVDRDPAVLATSLDSMTTALIRLTQDDPKQYSFEDRIDEVIAIFFGPVLAKRK